MLAIGCDPGLSGAIALVDGQQRLLECATLPTRSNGSKGTVKSMLDANALARLLDAWATRHGEPTRAAVERMFARPAQRDAQPTPGKALPAPSTATLLSMGYTAGAVEGVLWAMFGEVEGFTVLRPMPQQWKATYGLKSDKAASVLLARRLFLPRSAPARLRHDLAEAALIAHWATGGISIAAAPREPADACAF